MLIFVLALLVLLISSLPWVAVCRLTSKSSWLLAYYLTGSANVVLAAYITNSFHVLHQQWAMLAIHVCIGGSGWLVWYRFGKPSLSGPFQGWRPRFEVQWLKREPILVVLALFIALAYAFALVQIIHIPQNNTDSLGTHLSRIVFWRQHGSFFPWQTFMVDQVWYPVNAQLQTYWTLLFLNGDQLVGSIQWLAALFSALGVFGMARVLGYAPRRSAFAALIFLSFPLIALQSTTTQTDLVTMAFFIPSVYFLILGVRGGQSSLLILSAISVGIGIGVKKSYFLFLPTLVIFALLLLFQYGRRSLKQIMFWSLNLVLGVAIFGAYLYVTNWRNFGSPFGSPAYIDTLIENPLPQSAAPKAMLSLMPFNLDDASHRFDTVQHVLSGSMADSITQGGILMELVYNTPRLFYQALDTSGLPRPLDGYAHKVKMRLFQFIFQAIGFEEIEGTAYTAPGHTFSFSDKNINEESHAWYGPLSVLLILPALIIEARRGARQKFYLQWGPGVAILVFLPMEIILRPGWDPYQGRYFAPLIALCAPLMAFWFMEKGNAFHEWLISGLAVVIVVVTLLYNPSKPTFGKYADEMKVWSNDRIFVETIQRKNDREVYYLVEKFVPTDSTLGYYIPFFMMEYPMFGEDLTRRLMPMVSISQISDLHWLRDQGIDYLLLPGRDEYPLPPPEYVMIGKWQKWRLYAYIPAP